MHDERKLALIDADRRSLVRAATRLLGPADAEDAVQDAYVRALEAGMAEVNAAQAWLLTVMRNLAIDRLRRRQWMQQWLAQARAGDAALSSPSAEADAALAQEAARALRLLAACLAPADGAAVLLHEVFEASHADIAQAAGKSEAAGRQQLRRALARLRRAGGEPPSEPDANEEAVFGLYLRALQLRDPQALWAMLRQPPVRASATVSAGLSAVATDASATAPAPACGVVQAAGQLGLVLTLDGVTLCVLPLGVQTDRELQSAPAC